MSETEAVDGSGANERAPRALAELIADFYSPWYKPLLNRTESIAGLG